MWKGDIVNIFYYIWLQTPDRFCLGLRQILQQGTAWTNPLPGFLLQQETINDDDWVIILKGEKDTVSTGKC